MMLQIVIEDIHNIALTIECLIVISTRKDEIVAV